MNQYQKNEDCGNNHPSSNYVIRVSVFDADQKPLIFYDCNDCGTESQTFALDNVGNSFKTDLPVLMIITVGATDEDLIEFAYGDQFWNSGSASHHSKWGAYDNGKKEGDTGLPCMVDSKTEKDERSHPVCRMPISKPIG